MRRAFESLLALVKAYITDIWGERKSRLYGNIVRAQHLGNIAGVNGRNSKGLCQGGKPGTSCILMYVYVALPNPVGVWLACALGVIMITNNGSRRQ